MANDIFSCCGVYSTYASAVTYGQLRKLEQDEELALSDIEENDQSLSKRSFDFLEGEGDKEPVLLCSRLGHTIGGLVKIDVARNVLLLALCLI